MRYIFLIRAHHWVKNLFLFIPAFFAGSLLDSNRVVVLAEGFISFCLASSAIYILNDYRDMSVDKLHPVKKNRPLASGKVSPLFALIIMAMFLILSIGLALFLKTTFLYMLVLYILINVFYSFGLKDVPLLDVFLISSGFLIRTVSGGFLADIPISQWLVIMIFLLSLLLAFAKRRDDLVLAQESGDVIRKSSRQYSVEYIHICLSLISGIIMVSYIMYTVSEEVKQRIGENSLYFTSLFVFAGILRYLQLTLVKKEGGSPTKVFLTDRFIQATIAGWILTFFVTLYF